VTPDHDAAVVVVDPRLGAVVPAPAVRTVAGAARVLLDPSLPAPVAEAFARDLGALPADTTTPAAGDVVLTAGRDPHAPAGTELLEAVAVMDRLRSPGGCPWDAEQTHGSLLRYLVEETYELYDALAAGDVAATREELGDVLLQVLFHARVAQEGREAFDVDDVAGELVAKLVGRHPHVFGTGETIMTAGDQEVRWEELKAVEKRRDSVLDGVAAAQPAAALLAKYVSRARRAGVPDDLLVSDAGPHDDEHGTGPRLAALVARAVRDGDDPEGALRAAATAFAARVRAAEASARAAGEEPGAGRTEVWRRHWAS
jgi:XTP/dITP diphosphohydrolase